MGNLFESNSLAISVTPPSYTYFNFHHDYSSEQDIFDITFPSYLTKDNADQVRYSTRSAFNMRQYELGWEKEDGCDVIALNKVRKDAENIWKVIAPNQEIKLV